MFTKKRSDRQQHGPSFPIMSNRFRDAEGNVHEIRQKFHTVVKSERTKSGLAGFEFGVPDAIDGDISITGLQFCVTVPTAGSNFCVQLLHSTDPVGPRVIESHLVFGEAGDKTVTAHPFAMTVNASNAARLDPQDFLYYAVPVPGTSYIKVSFNEAHVRLSKSKAGQLYMVVCTDADGVDLVTVTMNYIYYDGWQQTYKIYPSDEENDYSTLARNVNEAITAGVVTRAIGNRSKMEAFGEELRYQRTNDPTAAESADDGHYWPYGTNRFPGQWASRSWMEISPYIYEGMTDVFKRNNTVYRGIVMNAGIASQKKTRAVKLPMTAAKRARMDIRNAKERKNPNTPARYVQRVKEAAGLGGALHRMTNMARAGLNKPPLGRRPASASKQAASKQPQSFTRGESTDTVAHHVVAEDEGEEMQEMQSWAKSEPYAAFEPFNPWSKQPRQESVNMNPDNQLVPQSQVTGVSVPALPSKATVPRHSSGHSVGGFSVPGVHASHTGHQMSALKSNKPGLGFGPGQ